MCQSTSDRPALCAQVNLTNFLVTRYTSALTLQVQSMGITFAV
jgi:hypothetical protein